MFRLPPFADTFFPTIVSYSLSACFAIFFSSYAIPPMCSRFVDFPSLEALNVSSQSPSLFRCECFHEGLISPLPSPDLLFIVLFAPGVLCSSYEKGRSLVTLYCLCLFPAFFLSSFLTLESILETESGFAVIPTNHLFLLFCPPFFFFFFPVSSPFEHWISPLYVATDARSASVYAYIISLSGYAFFALPGICSIPSSDTPL